MALRPPLRPVGFIVLCNLAAAVISRRAVPLGDTITVNRLYVQTKKTRAQGYKKNGAPLQPGRWGMTDCIFHNSLDVIFNKQTLMEMKVVPVGRFILPRLIGANRYF